MDWYFFRKLFEFACFFMACLLLWFLLLRQFDRFWNKNIPKAVPVAVFGSSHAEVSVDDSLLSRRLSVQVNNRGLSGQGVFWSTMAAKKSILQGTSLILFELNNFSYTSLENNLSSAALIRETGSMYYLKIKDWAFLLNNATKPTLDFFIKMPMPNRSFTGSYKENKRWLKNKTWPNYPKKDSFSFNITDTVLHQLIQANPKTTFIIFRAPQHPYFYISIGAENEFFFKSRLQLFNRYSNCQVMDFGNAFDADSVFADFGHLNLNGARILSEMLADSLMQFELNSTNFH